MKPGPGESPRTMFEKHEVDTYWVKTPATTLGRVEKARSVVWDKKAVLDKKKSKNDSIFLEGRAEALKN